jgi:hypothetical protein
MAGRLPVIGSRIVSAHDVVWRRIHPYQWRARNERSRRTLDQARPSLTAVQEDLVSGLRETGVARVPIGDLLGPDAWPALARDAEAWLRQPDVVERERAFRETGHQTARKKEFIIRLYGDGSFIPATSPWLQLALGTEILDVVNAYLGVYASLQYLDVWNTVAVPDRQRFTGSQHWHRDPEDRTIVKAFLYLSDVDEGAGPMHYVPGSRQGERYGGLWPQRFPDGSYPPADAFEREVPRSEWVVCAHPAGTLVLADTVGFHMGGRATTRNRVLATWCYATPGSVWGRGFSTDLSPDDTDLPLAARAALR